MTARVNSFLFMSVRPHDLLFNIDRLKHRLHRSWSIVGSAYLLGLFRTIASGKDDFVVSRRHADARRCYLIRRQLHLAIGRGDGLHRREGEIGRASCRERGWMRGGGGV